MNSITAASAHAAMMAARIAVSCLTRLSRSCRSIVRALVFRPFASKGREAAVDGIQPCYDLVVASLFRAPDGFDALVNQPRGVADVSGVPLLYLPHFCIYFADNAGAVADYCLDILADVCHLELVIVSLISYLAEFADVVALYLPDRDDDAYNGDYGSY